MCGTPFHLGRPVKPVEPLEWVGGSTYLIGCETWGGVPRIWLAFCTLTFGLGWHFTFSADHHGASTLADKSLHHSIMKTSMRLQVAIIVVVFGCAQEVDRLGALLQVKSVILWMSGAMRLDAVHQAQFGLVGG